MYFSAFQYPKKNYTHGWKKKKFSGKIPLRQFQREYVHVYCECAIAQLKRYVIKYNLNKQV
jgi:hypothetical protein